MCSSLNILWHCLSLGLDEDIISKVENEVFLDWSGPKSSDWRPCKKERHRARGFSASCLLARGQRQRGVDAVTARAPWGLLAEARKDSSLEPVEGAGPHGHPAF